MADLAYSEGEWASSDALTLRYRDYPGPDWRPPILCLPGLTRNARDFEPVVQVFAGDWRVICADLRGRGQSDYAKDSASYNPVQYVADVIALLDSVGIDRVVALGTSLGGIVTMLLAAQSPDRIAAAVLNDIGPDVEAKGLARIRDYVGQGRSFPTWMHAARALRDQAGAIYPDFAIADWLRIAKRWLAVSGNGRIVFDYDMRIAEPIHQADITAPSFDMWPAFRALAGRPLLAIRGESSDILSARTLKRMEREVPGMEAITVPRTGHAPTLEEPPVQAAIARLLAQVA
ncbi:MAG TPA: alpha/beta hydrolase [Croceibacterium sp.]|nr:alpha/beta hydrolase [Croceibacterium sp.]